MANTHKKPFSTATRDKVLRQILPTIQKNCTISDASHSGLFSVCGLFLRLKDQYNWEQKIPPWSPTDKNRLLQWIDHKETLWLKCLDSPLEPIVIDGKSFDFLNSQGINQTLIPLGLYYGAGYGRGLKPTFFLGTATEIRLFQGYTVIVLDHELACDLSLSPAQRQGKVIVLRQDPLRFFLWAKIQETEQFEREATAKALSYYGWETSLPPDKQLESIVQSEQETVLFHELGEAKDRTITRSLWRSLLEWFPFSRVELYLRSLKDLLADTHPQGTLQHIIRERKKGSLVFYLSNLKGLRQALFPEMVAAIQQFIEREDWSIVETARRQGRHRMITQANRLSEISETVTTSGPDHFLNLFEKELFTPLTTAS
ncbi:MAG: hypothetical protein C0407_11850 [Desulfobacca sp.]|nr:hypothetical protein [Desulfobacca sp.]